MLKRSHRYFLLLALILALVIWAFGVFAWIAATAPPDVEEQQIISGIRKNSLASSGGGW